jgi:hypothetical protein
VPEQLLERTSTRDSGEGGGPVDQDDRMHSLHTSTAVTTCSDDGDSAPENALVAVPMEAVLVSIVGGCPGRSKLVNRQYLLPNTTERSV